MHSYSSVVFHSVLCLYILTKIKNNYRGRSRKEGIKANYSFCTAITLSLINCLFVGGPLMLGFFTLNKYNSTMGSWLAESMEGFSHGGQTVKLYGDFRLPSGLVSLTQY